MRHTRYLQGIVSGGFIVLVNMARLPDAHAAPNSGVHDFCRNSSDLCVFVCTDWQRCDGMPDGFICESRYGELLVEEGGDLVMVYGETFAYCWYYDVPVDRRPEPGETYVPEYPGNPNDGLCAACNVAARRCKTNVRNFRKLCEEHLADIYEDHCIDSLYRHGRPVGRRGKLLGTDRDCELFFEEDFDPDETTGGVQRHRKRLLQEKRRCQSKLVLKCIDDFAQSHPEETVENTIPLKIEDILGAKIEVGYQRSTTVHWGGNIGYIEACNIAMGAAASQCAEEQRACRRRADPYESCTTR